MSKVINFKETISFKLWRNSIENATQMANNGEQPVSLQSFDSSLNTGRDDGFSEEYRQVLVLDLTVWKIGCSEMNTPLFQELGAEKLRGNVIPFGQYSNLDLWHLPFGMVLSEDSMQIDKAFDLQQYFNDEVWPNYDDE
jgi:hypothetical protein